MRRVRSSYASRLAPARPPPSGLAGAAHADEAETSHWSGLAALLLRTLALWKSPEGFGPHPAEAEHANHRYTDRSPHRRSRPRDNGSILPLPQNIRGGAKATTPADADRGAISIIHQLKFNQNQMVIATERLHSSRQRACVVIARAAGRLFAAGCRMLISRTVRAAASVRFRTSALWKSSEGSGLRWSANMSLTDTRPRRSLRRSRPRRTARSCRYPSHIKGGAIQRSAPRYSPKDSLSRSRPRTGDTIWREAGDEARQRSCVATDAAWEALGIVADRGAGRSGETITGPLSSEAAGRHRCQSIEERAAPTPSRPS